MAEESDMKKPDMPEPEEPNQNALEKALSDLKKAKKKIDKLKKDAKKKRFCPEPLTGEASALGSQFRQGVMQYLDQREEVDLLHKKLVLTLFKHEHLALRFKTEHMDKKRLFPLYHMMYRFPEPDDWDVYVVEVILKDGPIAQEYPQHFEFMGFHSLMRHIEDYHLNERYPALIEKVNVLMKQVLHFFVVIMMQVAQAPSDSSSDSSSTSSSD